MTQRPGLKQPQAAGLEERRRCRATARITARRKSTEIKAKAGSKLSFDASGSYDPDGDGLRFEWWFQVFPDETALPEIAGADSPKAVIEIPGDAAGRQLHLVCEVHDDGPFNLVSYRRIIISVD